jgi:hypothetical protein
MIGSIVAFDRQAGRGLIRGQGGAGDFGFITADLRCSPAKVKEGSLVSFLPITVADGQAVAAMVQLEPEAERPPA